MLAQVTRQILHSLIKLKEVFNFCIAQIQPSIAKLPCS